MELILDTNQDCFLCLQKISKTEENELSLKNICRLFHIDTSAMLVQELMERKQDIDDFNCNSLEEIKCSFSVNLCNPCFAVAGNLSSLIHSLEVLQLRVNYYSEMFQKILDGADLMTSANQKAGASGTDDARVVQRLRMKAKHKCSARNRDFATNKLPLVMLNRLTQEMEITSTKMDRTSAPAGLDDANIGTSIWNSKLYSNNSTVEHAKPHAKVAEDTTAKNRSIKKARVSSGLRQGNERDNSSMSRCLKRATVGKEAFQSTSNFLGVHSENALSNSNGKTNCRRNTRENFSKRQILQEREYTAKKKLNNAQGSDESSKSRHGSGEMKKLNKKSQWNKPSNSSSACRHCGQSFPGLHKLQLHMVQLHPDQIFLPFKPTHQSLSDFADSCRDLFKRETWRSRSEKGAGACTAVHECKYCGVTRRRKIDLLRHLVYIHREVLEKKIKVLEDPDHNNAGYPVMEQKEDTAWVSCPPDDLDDNFGNYLIGENWDHVQGTTVDTEEHDENDTKPSIE